MPILHNSADAPAGANHVDCAALGDAAEAGADHSAATRQQAPYRMLIHHDGTHYVAEVPELSGCRGLGSSYAEAVSNAESAIGDWLRAARASGQTPPPLLNPTSLARKFRHCAADPEPGGDRRRQLAPAKQQLIDKFGKMSNRQLAARIGLIERDAPLMLSAAASGKGTRKARCAIALALDELPSILWPERAAVICQDDDACYRAWRQASPVPAAPRT